jgi:hypothetical protein
MPTTLGFVIAAWGPMALLGLGCLSELLDSDRAVERVEMTGAAPSLRASARLDRVVARRMYDHRHVGRSPFLVGLAALLIAGCGATTVDEPTGESSANLGNGGNNQPDPLAQAILDRFHTCQKVSHTPYAKDVGGPNEVDVCWKPSAVFFKADMDIDCDGKRSDVCNSDADPSYQSQTAATDSHGRPLDAAKLPYIVVPGPSSRWDYRASGVALGSVAAVIYNGQITFGIVGDIGPKTIIGEASYAMAKSLGINPNPATGGVDSGVTYVIFTGDVGVVSRNEDNAEADTLGRTLAISLISGP